jgi:predicted metal-dependent phosphoesterase TrpH
MSSHVGTNGFLTVAADLHTHAIGDGRFGAGTPDRIARHLEGALEAGLRVVAVTDHDDLRPGTLAVEHAEHHGLPLLVLAGMEVTTSDGHLVVLGLTEPVAPWRSMTETIAAARAQGALCLLPHPFFPRLRERDDVDAIERLNFRYGDFDVAREDIAVIASSDAHSPDDLRENPHQTLLRVDHLSLEGVAGALRARRVSIEQRGG